VAVPDYFVHETSIIAPAARIGRGTKIWHFCHVMDADIGQDCSFGQNCFVGDGVVVGNGVKVQNNVSLYSGTIVQDHVFLGPSCVLTNVSNPRAEVVRHELYEPTLLRRGATVGANATIVCGSTLGRYAFVGAGAVVSGEIPDYALVLGVPGRRRGWMSRHGHRLTPDASGVLRCPESGLRYAEVPPGRLHCLDLHEDEPLPEPLRRGKARYREVPR
jgi:UDP-2-acetamido-3-amino-2,3-dideoxy-glucuronate N-acetyltransferase